MTSAERHQARYLRRVANRLEKRAKACGEFDNFEKVCDLNSLYDAYKKSKKGINWKTSTQKFSLNLFNNLNKLHDDLMSGKDVRRGFIKFDLCERGKLRHISSVHFAERVVQRSLCDYALVPMLSRSLIYDNGASMKGKGIDFAINRCEAFLHRYFRLYGDDGYVLQVDFSSYFENIDHDCMLKIIDEVFTDERLKKLIKDFITAYGDKGLGIGSQVSQISAISFMNSIDHYIKEVLLVEFYIRYMDDSLMFFRTKKEAKHALEVLREKYKELGIIVNEKKTHIIKISHGFTFLKTKFFLTKTGKVIKKICHRSVVTMRRKLKKFKNFLDKGVMTFEQIRNSFMSWVGYASHKNAYKTIVSMVKLFERLFRDNLPNGRLAIAYN